MCNDSEIILTNNVSNSVNVMVISEDENVNDKNRDKVECTADDFEGIESSLVLIEICWYYGYC